MLSAKNVEDRVSFCQRMIRDGFADDSQLGKIKRANFLFTNESPINIQHVSGKNNPVTDALPRVCVNDIRVDGIDYTALAACQ